MKLANDDNMSVGLALSLIGHFGLLYLLIFGVGINWSFQEPQVFSVTIEGGTNIGGINQFEDSKRKVPLANALTAEKPKTPPPAPEVKKEEVKPEPKKEAPKAEEKAEISIAEKKEPVKKEEKKEEKKETPKKLDKPEKKKEEPKPPPKKSEKEQSDDEYKKLMAKQMQSTNAGGKGVGAAALGGHSTGGGQVRPPEFFAYLRLLEQHVKSGWHWYDTSADLQVQMTFNISAEGVVSNIQVYKSSGNREFDESVLRAIAKASPVPMPPANVYSDFKFVRMTFDPRE